MLEMNLDGRATLVVGGSRGIGASVVEQVAAAGSKVAWTHLGTDKDQADSEKLMRLVEPHDREAMHFGVDCTDEVETRKLVETLLEKWGALDHMVYCAGYTSPVSMLDLDAEEWRRVVDINLTGAFIAVRAVLPHMVGRGSGSMVLVGSAAIVAGGGGRADYVSAKAGMEGLNRAITKEFAKQGIRCNVVHPSLIDTELLHTRHPDPETRAELGKKVPIGRLGLPADVSAATVFLLSDLAGYITGQNLFIDGGRTFCG